MAARVIKDFVQENMPELTSFENSTRLCRYINSFDNHFVLDLVPETTNSVVATARSGHGFKFLPNLGAHVVDLLESKAKPYLHPWRWRASGMERSLTTA